MKLTATACVVAAVLGVACICGALADSVMCGPYMFMSYWTGGGPSYYCRSPTNFGASSNGGSGYVAIYSGCHWGHCSDDKTFPRLVSDLGSLSTSFVGSSSGASHFDQTYDVWFDEQSNPNGRNAHFELMIWGSWQSNSPLARQYDAQGHAVPTTRGVNVAGATWDFYYCNPGGSGDNGPTFSFLRTPQSSSLSFRIKDFSDWLIQHNYMKAGLWCTSVQAGWEFNTNGQFTGTNFAITPGSPTPTVATCAVSAGEDQPVALGCATGQVINSVDYASYGTPSGDCTTGFTSSTCNSNTSLSVVRTACVGKNSCTISASNSVFGDPCSGISKRLAAKVTCVTPVVESTCAVADENQAVSLACASGRKITKVNYASYGTPQGSCSSFTTSTCHSSTSQSVVEAACLGKSSCTVQAANSVFGDPCSGTLKKLAAAVTCA